MTSGSSINLSWVVNQLPSGSHELVCGNSRLVDLNSGEILVKVEYSSLNYKDVLTMTAKNGETKSYPQIIGVDAVGTIVQSCDPTFTVGMRLGLFSRGLGTTKGGGLTHQLVTRVGSPVMLPSSISSLKAMAIGTAGLTAAACVAQIQNHGIQPSSGPILITGAGGGVGTIASLMLRQLGFQAVLSTRGGISDVVNPMQVIPPLKATHFQLLPEKWVAVLDTLGGESLVTAIKSTRAGGLVLSVGMVQSPNFSLSVYPFILRGIKLMGINLDRIENRDISLYLDLADTLLPDSLLMGFVKVIDFQEVPVYLELIANGKHSGRTVVRVAASE